MKVRAHVLIASVTWDIAVMCAALFIVGVPSIARAAGVVGMGTADTCTDAGLNTALAGGGLVTFDCGADPVTIDISTGTGTKTISADTTIDGGSLITISGGYRVGVFSVNAGVTFTVQNLTVANGWSGGGIFNNGTLTVTNSTFFDNTATDSGDGIANDGTATLTNTIVAPGGNCSTGVTDGGHNLDSGTSCGFSEANGSLSNTDPQLDPAGLQDNGGPTETVALCTGAGVPAGCTGASPAIDAGDNTYCPATDQRGVPRPYGSTCDIGAYESGVQLPPTGCPQMPSDTCFSAGKNSVKLRANVSAAKRQFAWKWNKGPLPLVQDFGDPVNGGTRYKLCVYDETGGSPVLKMGTTVRPGGLCGATPCWSALGSTGWSYKNNTGNADGIMKLSLKAGAAGKPKVQVIGGGTSLPLPTPISGTAFFDQDPAVIVQLYSSSPINCWSSTFDASSTRANNEMRFKAVTP